MLHSIFWQNLSPDGGGRPGGELAAAIDEYIGSFGAFSKRLSTATTGVQGSGWEILGYEPLSDRLNIERLYVWESTGRSRSATTGGFAGVRVFQS